MNNAPETIWYSPATGVVFPNVPVTKEIRNDCIQYFNPNITKEYESALKKDAVIAYKLKHVKIIDILFDAKCVEIEDSDGNFIIVGDWIKHDDYWTLRISCATDDTPFKEGYNA